ncbi:ribonuclease HI [Gloeobacter morelensis]|uniref:Ribonuclease H n=1 Tax=Gloeobacter morelensis MG652769 TaxID=2781736 RepID=A0ABY3PJH2_9CYAN|nr:ribonuclease HI [Gloeobacter morelensis]UFP93764.1 ribonuclease HI [Gloeobacter morelensis MG652769]
MFRIATDGACTGNPGPGGWAALVVGEGTYEEVFGFEPHTTNNRMEMRAVIEGLARVPADARVKVLTDSQYVIKGMSEWLPGWKRRGWITAAGKPVENQDLWEALERAAGRRVLWEHVRGHTGHPENERANTLAQTAARGGAPRAAPANGTTYLSLVDGRLSRSASWSACQALVQGVSGARYKKCRNRAEELDAVVAWGLPPAALVQLEG